MLLKEVFTHFSYYSFEKANRLFTEKLTRKLFSVFQKNYEYFSHMEQGTILSRIFSDSEKLSNFFIPHVLFWIRDFLTFLVAFSVGCYLNFRLAFIAVAPLIIFAFIRRFVNPSIRNISKSVVVAHTTFMSMLTEGISHMPLFRIYLKEAVNIDKIGKTLTNYVKEDIQRKKTIVLLNTPLSIMFSMGYVLSILAGAYFIQMKFINIGTLFGFLIILQYIYDPFPRLLQFNTYLQETKPIFERINEILEQENDAKIIKQKKLDNIDKIDSLNVAIDNFFHRGEDSPIVSNVSFNLFPGDCLGIIGESGVGKTTIVKILLGLYQTNFVTVNNLSLSKISLENWWCHIGYFSQDPAIFSGTIQENLFTELPIYNIEKDFLEFIDDIEHGKIFEENGKNISGGQKQRISLLRALKYKIPEVIILDEPIAHLDQQRIDQLKSILKKYFSKKIIIIISHQDQLQDLFTKVIKLNRDQQLQEA